MPDLPRSHGCGGDRVSKLASLEEVFPLRVPWRCFMAEVPSRRTISAHDGERPFSKLRLSGIFWSMESRLAFYNDATDLTIFEIRFTYVYVRAHTYAHLCSIYTSSSSDSHNFFSPSCIAQWFLMCAELDSTFVVSNSMIFLQEKFYDFYVTYKHLVNVDQIQKFCKSCSVM